MIPITRSSVIVFLLFAVLNPNTPLVYRADPTPFVASYVVTTVLDELDLGGPGTGCSLREAILSANFDDTGGCISNGGTPPSIYIPAGTYLLDFGPAMARSGEDGGTIGDLDIYTGMSIFGDGIGVTIIDGVNTDRIFDIFSGYDEMVSIGYLSIYHGNPGAGNGGAIRNNSNLGLTSVRIDSNRTGSHGAGVYHKSGPRPVGAIHRLQSAEAPQVYSILTIDQCTFANNEADGYGGGIHIDTGSGMLLANSTILFNIADHDLNGNGGGGGIYNQSEMDVTLDSTNITNNNSGNAPGGGFYSAYGSGDSVIILDSYFGANSTNNYGGNIVHGSDGVFEIYSSEVSFGSAAVGAGLYTGGNTYLENMTFSQNTATSQGGAIYVGLGEVEIIHVTIADNTGELGAGIYSAGDARLKSSILSNNRTAAGSLTNCISLHPLTNITSLGYNLTDGSFCAAPMSGDLAHTDPLLGAFDRHGSLNGTWTYALQLASPAIDAADPAGGPLVDQRGVSRPQPVGGVRDIGAYESNVDRWFLPLIIR